MINGLGLSKKALSIVIGLASLICITQAAVPRTSFTIPQCSAPKERIRRALSLDHPHIRKKRTIVVPKGTAFECKWAINMPFETQRRYQAKLQVAIPIPVNIPAILLEEYGLEKLKGLVPEDFGKEETERKDDRYTAQYVGNSYEPVGYHSSHLPAGYNPHVEYDGVGEQSYSPMQHHIHKRNIALSNYTKLVQEERIYFYRHIEGMLSKLGLPARDCLLRTVCEVAHEPVEYGLYGDMFNLLLTPSLATGSGEADIGYMEELSDYIRAEKVGHLNGRCFDNYEICPVSLFDLLPLVVNALFGA
ncbi:Protein of unknown function DM4/12 [Trinorchestia longiramus]|nr:Protein of unknown function DM4/12 [Trinorchestia longiramus]